MYPPEPGSREFQARYNAQLDRFRRATRIRNWGIAQLVGSFVLTGVGGAIVASCPYDSYYYYERSAGCVAGGATLVYIGSGLMFPIGIVMTPLGAARRGNARRELELLDSLGPRADFGPLVLPGGGGARVSLRF